MADRPDAQPIVLDVVWCTGCGGDRTAEVVRLAGDPVEVAVCLDCGTGVETWWQFGLPESRRGGAAVATQDAPGAGARRGARAS